MNFVNDFFVKSENCLKKIIRKNKSDQTYDRSMMIA